jgi:putative flippase GtrA
MIDALKDPRTRAKILRWFAAGLAFMGINTVVLYGLVGLGNMTVPLATLVAAEACTLLRFFVNHYWVFRLRRPTAGNLVSYHVANAGAFAVWWLTANLLTFFGMHYLLASIAAVGASTLLSLWTNFLWIWRHRHRDD